MKLVRFLDTVVRSLAGILVFILIFITSCLIMLLFLPFRRVRITIGSYTGKIIGYCFVKIMRIHLRIENQHFLKDCFPAIYIMNHASALDMFLGIFLCPADSFVIAKKEIAWIPLMGLAYILSGHLRIDRKNKERAIASLNQNTAYIQKHRLGLMMWPEGTRSADGRLQPFKKGVAHFALATHLPIVPIVMHDTHKKWPRGTGPNFSPTNLFITVLSPMDTHSWTQENLDEKMEEVRQRFIETLGPEQKPKIEGPNII